jgi:hypothetical protein
MEAWREASSSQRMRRKREHQQRAAAWQMWVTSHPDGRWSSWFFFRRHYRSELRSDHRSGVRDAERYRSRYRNGEDELAFARLAPDDRRRLQQWLSGDTLSADDRFQRTEDAIEWLLSQPTEEHIDLEKLIGPKAPKAPCHASEDGSGTSSPEASVPLLPPSDIAPSGARAMGSESYPGWPAIAAQHRTLSARAAELPGGSTRS